jgi:hypothetical protein
MAGKGLFPSSGSLIGAFDHRHPDHDQFGRGIAAEALFDGIDDGFQGDGAAIAEQALADGVDPARVDARQRQGVENFKSLIMNGDLLTAGKFDVMNEHLYLRIERRA